MEKSAWLLSMFNAEFYPTHIKDQNVKKAYFCVDCGGNSLTKKEMEAKHQDHRIFRPMKVSHHYAYTKDDILSLGSDVLNVSEIHVYCITSTSVYFPRPR